MTAGTSSMRETIQSRDIGKRYAAAGRRALTLNEAVPELIAALLQKARPRRTGQFREEMASPSEADVWVLKNVSFDLYPGDVLGVIGRNGAGKSTLLKILSGVVSPTEGDVAFRGRLGSLLETGAGFHPELSGRDNVFLYGSILGMKRDEIRRKFDAIVDFAEMSRFLEMPVKHYSNGMFVRLAFSVAAHLEPDILIVDEVLAVGDTRFQTRCRDKIREFTGQEKTVLIVSHDVSAIVGLCNKAMLLEHGRVVASGDVRECIERYLGSDAEGGDTFWKGSLGDENIRLSSVLVVPEGSSWSFRRGDVVHFQFTYEVLKPSPLVVVGVDVQNELGALVCATRFTDVAPLEQIPELQARGSHTVRLAIDTSILAEGQYLLRVNLGIHNVKRIIETEPVIRISVRDPDRNRKHESPMYRNIVYPHWEWREIEG